MPLGGGSCPSAALEAALTFAEHSSTRKNAIAEMARDYASAVLTGKL